MPDKGNGEGNGRHQEAIDNVDKDKIDDWIHHIRSSWMLIRAEQPLQELYEAIHENRTMEEIQAKVGNVLVQGEKIIRLAKREIENEMGRIIVIEDNLVFRDHMCGMLEKAGYTTRTAYDCAGARKLLEALETDDIVLSRPASARRGMYGIAGIYACFRHEESLCHHDRLRTGGFGGQFHEAKVQRTISPKTVAGKTDADDKGTGSKVKNQTHRPHIRAQKCDLSGNKPTYRAGSSDRHGCADTG